MIRQHTKLRDLMVPLKGVRLFTCSAATTELALHASEGFAALLLLRCRRVREILREDVLHDVERAGVKLTDLMSSMSLQSAVHTCSFDQSLPETRTCPNQKKPLRKVLPGIKELREELQLLPHLKTDPPPKVCTSRSHMPAWPKYLGV